MSRGISPPESAGATGNADRLPRERFRTGGVPILSGIAALSLALALALARNVSPLIGEPGILGHAFAILVSLAFGVFVYIACELRRHHAVRAQMEEALRKSEATTRAILDTAVDGISTIDDITSRKLAEEEIRTRARQQAVVADLGQLALADPDLAVLMNQATALLASTLGVEYACVLELTDDGSALLLKAGVGWREGFVGHVTSSTDAATHPGYTLTRNKPVIVADLTAEGRFSGPPFLREHGVVSGLNVLIHGRTRPLGVLGVYAGKNRAFGLDDVHFAQGVANVLAHAIERAGAEDVLQQEARVSSALAHVGRTLISLLEEPVLLDRLCEVTAEALGCDSSYTLLWEPQDEVYLPVAGYGGTPEEEELARTSRIPREAMAVLLSRLEDDDIVTVRTIPEDVISASDRERYGVALQLCIALRRGKEIIGIQVASSRARTQPFTPQEERIAAGIAQLAALALQNARLLQKLDEANRLKSVFVSTMSHELRTPLNVIIGYDDLLLDGAFGPLDSGPMDALRRIGLSARHLLELINATLDLGRLESRNEPVDLSEVNLADLLAAVEDETRPIAKDKPRVRFSWQLSSPALIRVRTDGAKLKVILRNLVGNGLKFTDEGDVTLRARAAEGGVEFCVTDTGIGISPESMPVVFEAFRQADDSSTRRHDGVGLGLYIVRKLVDLLGGTIAVESEVGRGTTFRMWIPDVVDVSSGAASWLLGGRVPTCDHSRSAGLRRVHCEDIEAASSQADVSLDSAAHR